MKEKKLNKDEWKQKFYPIYELGRPNYYLEVDKLLDKLFRLIESSAEIEPK